MGDFAKFSILRNQCINFNTDFEKIKNFFKILFEAIKTDLGTYGRFCKIFYFAKSVYKF
ncbi:hypothetical protein MBFIL_09550 [Methanobrevibacter filiformis]|uniref:Uncharacterized protein n=1 Tax=Methanobrevibacter filiformis TaxID=55758 RepID=A0A166C024_9EURY|nr:hypothetical protein MBFIL_09550 [Methanobrevibacter filiformis]